MKENYDPFKAHDIILTSQKIEYEIHMHKSPCWQVMHALNR